MDYLLQDFRLAFRRLRKSPGFAAAAIITLALGIGANTTTFSAINALILRPLPVERPRELVYLNSRTGPTQSYPSYKDFRDRTRTLSGLVGYRIAPVAWTQDGNNAHAWGYEATGNYFQVLGIKAILGRTFTPAEDEKPGAHPVVVISYSTWQRRFARDPGVVGKTVKINGLAYTILGVTPPDFSGTELLYFPEFWVPLAMEPQIEPGNKWLDNRNTWNTSVLGRLKPGITAGQAEAELNTIAAQIGREHPEVEGMRVHLSPPGLVGNALRGAVVGFASVLMGLAGLVLLIACTNLASLLLARAADRQKEIAVQLALGAGKLRLVRQLLVESLLLSVAGTAAGLLLASWIVELLAVWRPPIDIPLSTNFALDLRVLAFAAAVCVLTSVLFGLIPALGAVRTELVSALRNAPVTQRLRRLQFREVLVTAQITLSVVLLVGTVLVVRSLQRALTIDIGFNPQHAVAVSFDLGLEGLDSARGSQFQQRLLEKISALPGIETAGWANSLPLGLDQSTTEIYAEGKPIPKPSAVPGANYYMVSPGYFRTMRTRLLRGRDFDQRDRKGSKPVAIVNHAFAARIFPNVDAVGKRFRQGPHGDLVEIVGIVEDGKYVSLSDGPTSVIFWPALQDYNSTTTVVARSVLPAEHAVRMIEQVVHEMDPGMPFFQAGSLDDHMRLPLMPARIAAWMLGAFGGLAMVLAATGVYGVMAYAVARRRREIGIRVAIGATRSHIMKLVVRRTLVLLGAGAALGAVCALAVGGLFSPVLYGVSSKDPATFALAILLITLIALAACWLPARRAMSIEPSSALREE